jgi:hypothetical protein
MIVRRILTALVVASILVACQSPDAMLGGSHRVSTLGEGNEPNDTPGQDDAGKANGEPGSAGSVRPASACAAFTSAATRPPAYLVFVYGRSLGMNDPIGDTTKWAACKTAFGSFFADPASAGIQASLTFFPKDSASSADACSNTTYATPEVTMRALPDATAYAGAFAAGVSKSSGIPTLAAEQGAIAYALQLKAGPAHDGKIAIVLVTDGDPQSCDGNDVTAVATSAAAAAAANIPTHVIGIGEGLTNLKTIASAGGTTPILVGTGSASRLKADLASAVRSIATAELGCEYGLPAPPAGTSLDVNAVNVDFTASGETQKTLTYSANCGDANGWHYDSTSNPTKIVLCPGTCNMLGAEGKVDVVFGCATNVAAGGALPVVR